jgi:glycosyltransferase involved in cell wall biosynthesis
LRVLIITQWFDPEPTFKGLLFAKKLQEAGNDVEVITGFPNYPGGKIYAGYKIKLYSKEVVDGVTVHRVPLYPSHDRSALKRVLNYVSFFLSSFFCGICKVRKPDVIYAYHPPLTTALSAVFISKVRRSPYIVDIQDLWPDTLAATGMLKNPRLLGIVHWFCKLVYRNASKVVVLSPGFKKMLVQRGVEEAKIRVIMNWCDEDALTKPLSCEHKLPSNQRLNVVFAGNLGNAQGLPSIIAAAKILADQSVAANIVFVGDGIAKAEAESSVKGGGLDNVFFVPRIPMAQIGTLLMAADILLVHLKGDPLFSITIPSRTQAYMAIGKPIIMGVDGDAADVVQQADCGIACKPESPESLASAITILARASAAERKKMGANAFQFYRSKMSVEAGVKQFQSVFEEVA